MYSGHKKLTLARIIVTITLGCAITYETNGDSIEESHTVTMSDIGVPVQSVNWVRLHPGRNHEGLPCLYATMGQTADVNICLSRIHCQLFWSLVTSCF